MLILGIETSCDDTSVALVDSEGVIHGMESENQDTTHAPHGGVIPELACRNHTLALLPLLENLLRRGGGAMDFRRIDGIAVTNRPGLIGSLMVGVTTAKTLSLVHKLPLVGINHLEGHLHAPLLKTEKYAPPLDFAYPYLGLCVSGGHTSLYLVKNFGRYVLLGKTLDDAAGEAFDKFGKILGLGYPAGRLVDKYSQEGNRQAFAFPRALMKPLSDLNFSFSGLKTAGKAACGNLSTRNLPDNIADLCASYQEAIVDVLVEKLARAVRQTRVKRAVITGGVSANTRFREKAQQWALEKNVSLLVPPLDLCTDNAAMIAYVGAQRLIRGEKDGLDLCAEASMKVTGGAL